MYFVLHVGRPAAFGSLRSQARSASGIAAANVVRSPAVCRGCSWAIRFQRLLRGLINLPLIRSVTHPDSTHTIAMHYMMTGQRHRRPATNPMNAPDDFPCFGAVMQKAAAQRHSAAIGNQSHCAGLEIPLGHIFPGFFAGFLGSGFDPMFITDDPSAEDFAPIRKVNGKERDVLDRRANLLSQLDAFRTRHDFDPHVQQSNAFHDKALQLISSAEASRAFDLKREPENIHERFGKSAFGQGCLLARRLVQAGVKLVTVNWAADLSAQCG